jgi:hypothetical protein
MPVADISEQEAHDALKRAYAAGRIVFYTDPHLVARPGSPAYNPLDVYAPPVVLMAGSLAFLFAFGLIEWIVALVLVLLYQVYGAPRVVHWRVQRRVVDAALRHPHNLKVFWEMGGMAIALKDWPERNCFAPGGDWRAFVGDCLSEAEPESAVG